MDAFSISLSLITILIYLLYKWATSTYGYFDKIGIPYIKPVPLFGNFMKMLFHKETLNDTVYKLYMSFQGKRLYGYYEMRTPMIAIRDPELIKQITIKDFDHFVDHRLIIDDEMEPLFGRSLFILTGQKWRDMRSTLSPAFTSRKMRTMFQLIIKCAEQTTTFILNEATKDNHECVREIKDLFTRFTNDVIASTAFGIEVDSLQNKENEFYMMGKKSSNFSGLAAVRFFMMSTVPNICKFFNINLFAKDTSRFFRSLVHDTIKYREDNNIVRPDMIHLLMQARKGSLMEIDDNNDKENNLNKLNSETDGFATATETSQFELKSVKKRQWEDDDLTAQCMVFFIAGFDSTATLITFAIYEICVNVDVQKKLINEIDDVRKILGGQQFTYDHLQKMKYLDMVISETLRKWPPAIGTDRVCVKPYTLLDIDGNGNQIVLNVKDNLFIPIYGIHRDPNYYPNPDKFDPERFSDENKGNIHPFTYIPFGTGPRNCIGSRLALMESKAIIVCLLSSLTFEVCEKTQIPLKLAKSGFNVKAEKGIHIRFKPRE